MQVSSSAPNLTRRPLLKGGTALLGLDHEATLQILRHQRRIESIKPSASVQRQEQERDWQRHQHFVRIRSRYPPPEPRGAAPRRDPNRRDFEKRLERMLLKDWDGKECDAGRLRQKAPAAASGVETAETTGGAAVEQLAPTETFEAPVEAETPTDLPMEEEHETQAAVPEAVVADAPAERTDPADMAPETSEAEVPVQPDVPNSYAGFGNPGAGGPGRMRPPDFRSILADSSAPSNQQLVSGDGNGGLGLKPLDSLSGGNAFSSGFGGNGGVGLKPLDVQPEGNAGSAIPSMSLQNNVTDGPSLQSVQPQSGLSENIGGSGQQVSGGVGVGRRRQRPPDVRSILQNDDESLAPASHQPITSGNDANGGLVLRPLDSLNGGGNAFGSGFGGNGLNQALPSNNGANGGLVLRPVDSLNGGANAFGSGFGGNGLNQALPSNNDANGGLVLRPLDSLNGGGNAFGSGFGGNGLNQALPSNNDANGGLVLRPLGSLNGGGNAFGSGLGGNAHNGLGFNPPDIRLQPNGNAGSAVPSMSLQNDATNGPSLQSVQQQGLSEHMAGNNSSASPASDFFKEENGYVPSAAGAGRRRRRGQL